MRQRVALARALAQDSRRAAHGRAVRRARRDDPRPPARRARGALDAHRPTVAVRDPQRARGGPPRRPGRAARRAGPGGSPHEFPIDDPPAPAHRLARGRRARGRDHRPTARGGAPPWRPCEAEPPGSTRLELAGRPERCSRRPRARRASGPRPGRSSARSRSRCCSGSSSCGRAGSPSTCCRGPVRRVPELFRNFGDYSSSRRSRPCSGRSSASRSRVVIGTCSARSSRRVASCAPAVGSMITGLMTMPSIAWFPAAIVLFGLDESAILLRGHPRCGAVDRERLHRRRRQHSADPAAGRAGAAARRAGQSFRHVVLPAALPTYVAGLKQGWAFAWRSLLAGELLVLIAGQGVPRSRARHRPAVRRLPGRSTR